MERPRKGAFLLCAGQNTAQRNPAIFLAMMRKPLIVLLLLAAMAPLHAQDKGYKIVRPDGTVEFSDQPAPGAQEITLPKAQSYQAPEASPPPAPPTPATPPAPPYSRLAIVAPEAEQTFQNGETNVSVSLVIEPALRPGHRVVILLDGSETASGGGSRYSLSGIERGSHVLIAEVRDGRGRVLERSAPVTFHMRQHSQLFDQPPPPADAPPSPVGPAPMMPRMK